MASIKAMTRIVCLSAPGYEGADSEVAGASAVVCDCLFASAMAAVSSKE